MLLGHRSGRNESLCLSRKLLSRAHLRLLVASWGKALCARLGGSVRLSSPNRERRCGNKAGRGPKVG